MFGWCSLTPLSALLTFFEPVRFCMEHPLERSERLLDTEPLLALEWPEGLECLAFTRMRRGTWCAVIQVSASVVNGFRMVYKVSDQLLSGINAGESGWKLWRGSLGTARPS